MGNKISKRAKALSGNQVRGEHIDIEFMYLDLSVCTRCRETGVHPLPQK